MELINNNQVPEGYKKTEVGVIPEDWEVVPLKDLIDADRRITYGIVVPGQHTSNGVPMIRAQDYSRGWVDIEDLYRVSPKIDESYKRSRVIPDDILLTIVGSVGNLAKVPSGFRNTNITQQTARLAFNKKAFADFYFNILQSKLGKNVILNYTKSGVQPSLNLSDVEKFNLPYPPLREQKAIAQTLSDVDALIDELDKLIAKKRNIKTGTMQQLLTGKTRLPGFGEGKGYKKSAIGVIPEDWEIEELGSVGKFKNGINKSSEDFGHGSPFVNLMDVFGVRSISEVEHLGLVHSNDAEKNVYNLKEGDVIFIRSSVKPSGVGLTTVIIRDLPDTVYSGFLIRFRDNGTLETDFKKYCFAEDKFRRNVIANSTVSANTNINQDSLKKLALAYPKSSKEQKAIAQVLSDIDSAIAALEKRRAKTLAIKQGMMQELLTGMTRLKIADTYDPITKNSNG